MGICLHSSPLAFYFSLFCSSPSSSIFFFFVRHLLNLYFVCTIIHTINITHKLKQLVSSPRHPKASCDTHAFSRFGRRLNFFSTWFSDIFTHTRYQVYRNFFAFSGPSESRPGGPAGGLRAWHLGATDARPLLLLIINALVRITV